MLRALNILTVHENIRDYECQFRKKACSNKNLKAHVSAVHRKIRDFQCQFCKYGSSYKGDLKKHVLKVHESKELPESNETISLVRK